LSVIPYVPRDIAEPRLLVDAIRARRGGELLNLDRMLLHSPPFAAGWNAFLGAVRTGLDVSPKLRELAICTVAFLNDAEYEFFQHAPVFIAAGGTPAQCDALRRAGTPAFDATQFGDDERAIIALTIEMTRNIDVTAATSDAARRALGSDRHLVELVGVIAAYNMVSRFLVALGVEQE
jgi:alkylhydroperoxidase family enzyme